jgi:hypothetical protein
MLLQTRQIKSNSGNYELKGVHINALFRIIRLIIHFQIAAHFVQ